MRERKGNGGATCSVSVRFRGNKLFGAPGGIRTPDPQIRSLVLWSAELRAQTNGRGARTRTGDLYHPMVAR